MEQSALSHGLGDSDNGSTGDISGRLKDFDNLPEQSTPPNIPINKMIQFYQDLRAILIKNKV